MRAALGGAGAQRRRPLPPRFRAGQGDARRRADRTRPSLIMPRQRAAAEDRSPTIATTSRETGRPLHRDIHRRSVRRAARRLRSADPIFIVGMPRAGSTLVEQILVIAQPGRRDVGAARHTRACAQGRQLSRSASLDAVSRTSAARLARNISSEPPVSGAPTARSSSTSCRTTGCSCRSSS